MSDTDPIIKPPETTTETSFIRRSSTEPDESHVFGLTVRSLVMIMFTATVCFVEIWQILHETQPDYKIDEPLYSAFLLALGFYFGQKGKTKL